MPDMTAYWAICLLAVTAAVVSVTWVKFQIRPLHKLVRRTEPHPGAPGIRRPRRVAIDARPMIGEPTEKGFRVYGVGQYLTHLVREIAKQDTETQYVLWSSSLRYGVPPWYDDFITSHHNFRALHLKLPNVIADPLSYFRFRFLHELIGTVEVSYDVNYFPVKPGNAFSICTVHDLAFRNNRLKQKRASLGWQERSAERAWMADKITTVSEASKARILKEIPRSRERDVEVIYGAADASFSPAFAQDRAVDVSRRYSLPAKYFLCVGEPALRKNLENVIDQFELLRQRWPETSLILTGFDAQQMKERYGDRARSNVHAIGYVPQSDLPSLYSQAQALVYPSFDEGFGLPVVEALSTGQVVITSDVPALREVAGDVALELDGRENAILDAMTRVLEMSTAERLRRVDEGLQRAIRFSWARSASQMLSLFELGLRSPQSSTKAP